MFDPVSHHVRCFAITSYDHKHCFEKCKHTWDHFWLANSINYYADTLKIENSLIIYSPLCRWMGWVKCLSPQKHFGVSGVVDNVWIKIFMRTIPFKSTSSVHSPTSHKCNFLIGCISSPWLYGLLFGMNQQSDWTVPFWFDWKWIRANQSVTICQCSALFFLPPLSPLCLPLSLCGLALVKIPSRPWEASGNDESLKEQTDS